MDSTQDDLYGDLNLVIEKKAKDNIRPNKKQKKHNSTMYATNATAPDETASLRKQLQAMQDENLRLKRNIGTLFRTAKTEIQRKDDQIERLQRELERT